MGASLNHITNRIGKKLGVNNDGDLQVCFNSSQKSQTWYFITNASNINKWARYKPFRHPSGVCYSDHYNDSNSTRLAGAASVNYGLSAPAAQQNFTNTFGNTWTYNSCVSGDPLETWDFEGYNGEAIPPVRTIGNLDVYLSSGSGFSFGSYIEQQPSGSDTITWQDLPASIGSYYLCVIFSKTSDFSGTLTAKTSSQTLSNSGITLDITYSELEQLYSNNYKYYYLVARSAQLNGMQSPTINSAYYLGLPSANSTNDLKGGFTIHAASVATINVASISKNQAPTMARHFVVASPFIGPESIPIIESDFFYCDSAPYYLHLGLEITAGSTAFTIGSPRVALSQTFFSATGFSSSVGCTLYDSSFTQQTQITIPAGTTQTVYLIASSAILSLDSSSHQQSGAGTDQYFSTTIKIYNGSTLIDQTNQLRVRNYSF